MMVPGQGEPSEPRAWSARSWHEAPAAGAKRPLAAEGRAVALELHRTQAKKLNKIHATICT